MSLQLLKDILVHRRAHSSIDEQNFLEWYRPFLAQYCDIEEDDSGNWIVRVGKEYTVMHSAHMDTVHNRRIEQNYQTIRYHKQTGIISRPYGSTECLGADDGAGIYVLHHLIKAQRPGLYIFHRGEERGGIGSGWLVTNTPEVVKGITHCFAYDRKGTTSVITHQMGQRCCSDELATIFANKTGMDFRPDPTGSFTDSAQYTHLIPECTNISVGYYAQHSGRETQDSKFLLKLTEALVNTDLNNIEVHNKIRENKFERRSKPLVFNKKLPVANTQAFH